MKFKNKLFITFIILLFFVLFFNISNVFAFEFTSNTGYTTNTHTVPDLETVPDEYISYLDTYGYIIQMWSNNKYRLIILTSANSYFYRGGSYAGNIFTNVSGSAVSFDIDISKHLSWSDVSVSDASGFSGYNFVYYNADIYTDKDKSDLFFQRPPQVVEEVTIPVLEGVEELPKAMTTTLKMILPVGLVVFGILLLVYIIRLYISQVI